MKMCAFCKKEPPTEKFYDNGREFETCAWCLNELVDAWEKKEFANRLYNDYVEVLEGDLKLEDLPEKPEKPEKL